LAALRIGQQLGRGDLAHVPMGALPDALRLGLVPSVTAPPVGPPPATEPVPPGDSVKPGEAPPVPAAAAPPAMPAAKAPQVHVPAVTGAPGPGNREMTEAMQRVLGQSMMVLVNRPQPGAWRVEGSVELSAPVEGRQRIVIRWVVKRGDGTPIGDLEQANNIRAGSLDGHWHELAPIVALAAVDAVVELIERDRASGGK
jgi:hypothetical protein